MGVDFHGKQIRKLDTASPWHFCRNM